MEKSPHNNFKVYFFPQPFRGRSVKEQQLFEHKCPLTLKGGAWSSEKLLYTTAVLTPSKSIMFACLNF